MVKLGQDDRYYLEERFREAGGGRSLPLNAYYKLKPLLPRRAQIAMRRRYARRQMRTEFPRWPIESVLVDHRQEEEASPSAPPWPDGKRFAAILTHDVEGPAGVANVREVIEIERRHGFVSCWNFVAEWYPIADGLFDHVRAAGCEIGLHGIKHDGKLFESRARFEAELPAIHRYLDRVGRGRVPLARHPPQRGLDARAGRALRQLLSRHRPLRAAARRLLLDPSLLPRRDGRAADHPGPGPHAVGDPAPGHDRALDAARATGSSPTAA